MHVSSRCRSQPARSLEWVSVLQLNLYQLLETSRREDGLRISLADWTHLSDLLKTHLSAHKDDNLIRQRSIRGHRPSVRHRSMTNSMS